jgi:conjugal transfer/type IV secretion protein DotA/TraY
LLTWHRFGHNLMSAGVWAMVAAVGAGIFSTAGGLLVASIGAFLYAQGWLLSTFLSYLPYLIWLFQVMSWLIAVVIAAFGMPLWMLMHLSGEGAGISGARAQSGYGLVLSLLLRPVLLTFGLFASIALLYVLGGFIDQTLGTTLQNPPNSVFESIGLIAIYVIVIVSLAGLCLRTITLVPQLAFAWIDVLLDTSASGSEAEAGDRLKGGGGGVPGAADRSVPVARGIGRRFGAWRRKRNT